MAENRRKYTREYKVQAVGMLERGEKTGQQIEEDLGIGKGLIYRWRAQLAQEGSGAGIRAFPGNGKPRDEELAALRKELKNVREERDILRKAVAIFSRPQK